MANIGGVRCHAPNNIGHKTMSQEKSLVTLGERLKLIRKEQNLTLASLAKIVGSSQGYLSQVEHGAFNPSDKLVVAICAKLGVNETWLMTGEGEKFADPTTQTTRHPDPWLQSLLESLVKFWLSSDARQQWLVTNTLSAAFGDTIHTWMAERNPPLEPHELKYVPNLDNLMDAQLMNQLREVSPELATRMKQIVSSLLLATIKDYCDFLKEWWDQASDDEHAWARVELKRRLPMLF